MRTVFLTLLLLTIGMAFASIVYLEFAHADHSNVLHIVNIIAVLITLLKVYDTHQVVNSRMDEMLEITRTIAYHKGQAAGRAELEIEDQSQPRRT